MKAQGRRLKAEGTRPRDFFWLKLWLGIAAFVLLVAGIITIEFHIWRVLHPDAPAWYFLLSK